MNPRIKGEATKLQEEKVEKYRLRKGAKVELWSADRKKFIGIGVFERRVAIQIFGMGMMTPVFRFKRWKYKGYECWWIPVTIANKVRRERSKAWANQPYTASTGNITLSTFRNSANV